MFEPDDRERGWIPHLQRLGLESFIAPITEWLSHYESLAWLLVCSSCNPHVELEQLLAVCETLNINGLCQLIASLEVTNWRAQTIPAEWDPLINTESFEEFVFAATHAIRDPLNAVERKALLDAVRASVLK
jgi:hypothetical protein